MANRDHKRSKEAMRLKDRSAASNAKLQAQSLRDKQRFAKPPTRGTTAKKTDKQPPKKSPKKK
jgi:hypothetical protein